MLLSVDDDPGVSRAVARDLRRKYGEDFRVLRASSAAEGLDALRELKLRGDAVAVLLADYRMPQMNGIEFLEQAMDLFPRARRALLTAYADTEAAIQAINLVDVDQYLLKPWEPVEEKLYPVVDSMITAWRESKDSAVDDVRIVGHHWSAPSYKARDFLARNAVPYRWYSVEEPEGQRLLAAAEARPGDVPVIVTPAGTVLRSPTPTELAAAVGLDVEPRTDFYDLVVVGGGPAGLGAAVYGASEGLRTVLVEKRATGGQPGRAAGSRTTWASRTASPARSWPTGPAARRRSSAPSWSPPAAWSPWRPPAPAAPCTSTTAAASPRTPSSWPRGCSGGRWARRAARS